MRHLSHPLLNTPSKVEQTRQLKKVEVTDIVIVRLHHIHIIIIDTTETIHLLLVTIRMNGHVDQNQGVSITVRMTSIEDIT